MQHRQTQKIGESAFKKENLWFFVYCWFLQFNCICEFMGIVLCRGAEMAFCICCEQVKMTCIV